MPAERSTFTKDGKTYATLTLKIGGDKSKFGFSFGASKARLILENLEAIKQFAADNPSQTKAAAAPAEETMILE